MHPHSTKQAEQSHTSVLTNSTQLKIDSAAQMLDTRTAQSAQRRTQSAANASQSSSQLKQLQAKMVGKSDTLQRVEEEEPAQTKTNETVNNTGLPNQLKAGIESLSGMSMDHVKVHYNSSQPAQLNAHAYAQGNEIHVAPGQEQHVPHEAWHVVQQAQGRVKPTMQMKMAVPVNDDAGLETEADVMGAKALGQGIQLAKGVIERKDTSAARSSTGKEIAQLKPSNFYRSYMLPMKEEKYAGYKGQRNGEIAKPLNELRKQNVLDTNADFIGGHLLKAEYGGGDVFDNVVPWCPAAERKFGTYEDKYLKKFENQYDFVKGYPEKIHGDQEWEFHFYLNVQYRDWTKENVGLSDRDTKGWSEGELIPILDTLSTIPDKVYVNAGGGMDDFENEGRAISGQIEMREKAAHKPPTEKVLVAEDDEVFLKRHVDRFTQNLKVFISHGNSLLEECKNDAWIEELNGHWIQEKIAVGNAISDTLEQIPEGREIVRKFEYQTVGSQKGYFTQGEELSRSWERMRKEVLHPDNQEHIERRSLDGAKRRINQLVLTYGSILKNNIFDFHNELTRRFE